MDRQFLIDRQQKLQTFLDTIQAEPVLRNHLAFKRFVDPDNYSTNFYGVCGVNVCVCVCVCVVYGLACPMCMHVHTYVKWGVVP